MIMLTEALAVCFLCGLHKVESAQCCQGYHAFESVMNIHQKETTVVIVAVLASVIALKTDISMTAMAGSCVLMLIGAADEKKATSSVNWNTLLLVSGMYMLITVVEKCGGIRLIADFLSEVVTAENGAGLMALLSSLMATVTSASGVVMPTLIPVCREISLNTGGAISALILAAGVASGANCAFFSPFSVLGSMTLAMYPETADHKILVKRHIQMTCCSIIFVTIIGFIGLLYI